MIQDWFREAKLGIFIHWGIYAVDGITESWSITNGSYSYDDYMKQLEGFTAKNYDPKKWAELIKAAGANYAVLTSKHHDGVALFDTEHTDLNVVKKTPAGRDLIGPYCDALREQGIHVGIYFTNTDWSDVDNMRVILDKSEEDVLEMRHTAQEYRTVWGEACKLSGDEGTQDKADLEAAWQRFMGRYRQGITELLTNYGEVDLLWFDVMLTREGFSWETDKVREMIRRLNPKTMVNARMVGQGDYETPELYIPLRPMEDTWELCSTFNNSWGFQPGDKKYKDIRQIVRMLCECISKGGNLLISIGPDAEGNIPKETEESMLALGDWTHRYAEAVYPTEKGLDPAYFLVGSTLSRDKKTLYLFSYDRPNGFLMLNGIKNKEMKITALKNGRELAYEIIGGAPWLDMPGQIWVRTEDGDLDDVCSVFRVEFEEPIRLVEIEENVSSVGGAD